jgi:hypothetical protein
VIAICSCNKKFNDVGTELLPNNKFGANKIIYPVKASHDLVNVIQTNNGSALQLGEINDLLFGGTSAAIISQIDLNSFSPVFGELSAEREIDSSFNELETITDVWLEIPFFTNQKDSDGDGLIDIYDIDDNDYDSDSDGDGVSDIDERNNGTDPLNADTDNDGTHDGEDTDTVNPNPDAKLYAIDSLFGDRNASFDVEVNKLNYFLRQLDPFNNFETYQAYYSDFLISNHKQSKLANEKISLNFSEIIRDSIDNIPPRFRVALDKNLFQDLVIDKEGNIELSSNVYWRDYFRSISVEVSNFSNPLLMLLDTNKMIIRLEYSYKKEITGSDPTEIEDVASEFLLNASGTIKFNTLNQTIAPSSDLNSIIADEEPSQIALSGGLASTANITFFEDIELLEEIKNKPWVINEANLTFHVDQQAVENYGLSLPKRLYVYNSNTQTPIIDFSLDATSTSSLNKLIYGGFLTEEEGDSTKYYKVRLTDHIRNIISNDSINVPLRVAITNDIPNQAQLTMATASGGNIKKVPAGTVVTPKSAVFVGPSPAKQDNMDLKLQLEIYYTEIN